MKRLYTRTRIFLITFSIGLACVPFLNGALESWEVVVELPQVKSGAPIFIFPAYRREMRTGSSGPSGYLLDGIQPTMRGCGNGYAQGYELPNGKRIGEGNDCYSSFKEAKKEMRNWLDKADSVIERISPVKTEQRKSERVVASFPVDEYGNKWITVMWIHDECIHWINAPDYEHALEFERSEFNPHKFEE